MKTCQFHISWVGRCDEPAVYGYDYCEKHLNTKCTICGKQATHECSEASQFVCGYPLCDDEKCRIKHHPNHYTLTPKEWAEVYEIEIDESKFKQGLDTRIKYEEFKNLVKGR